MVALAHRNLCSADLNLRTQMPDRTQGRHDRHVIQAKGCPDLIQGHPHAHALLLPGLTVRDRAPSQLPVWVLMGRPPFQQDLHVGLDQVMEHTEAETFPGHVELEAL